MKQYPKVIIHINRVNENVKKAVQRCQEYGIDIMGVTKVSNGLYGPNKAYVEGGVRYLGSSRLDQLEDARKQGIDIPLVLIRVPMLSEIEEMIDVCDLSLQSEIEVLRKTNEIAMKKGKIHQVILMVDIGDLREGFWDKEELLAVADEIETKMPGIYLYGIGTNVGCYGAIVATVEKMQEIVDISQDVEKRIGRKLDMVSVGGSTTIMRGWYGEMPKGITNIRTGGVPFMPRRNEENFGDNLTMNKDTVRIQAEIVSIKGNTATLALGMADYGDWCNLRLMDTSLRVTGATYDVTYVDLSTSEREYKLGDIIEFDGTYTTLVYISKSNSVVVEYVTD